MVPTSEVKETSKSLEIRRASSPAIKRNDYKRPEFRQWVKESTGKGDRGFSQILNGTFNETFEDFGLFLISSDAHEPLITLRLDF